MGLWKVDNVSSEEWQRRMLRQYNIRQWVMLIGLLLAMGGLIYGMIWALEVVIK